jgi:protein TonB
VLGGTGSLPMLAKVSVPQPAPPQKLRIAGGVAKGNLIHDVKPQYPLQARKAKIEGTVILLAVIGKDGSVQNVQVKSGLPLLAEAAIEAVKQWRYKPYLLNGQPVEVDTQITIDFTLAGA